jgi:hypothetical protein
LQLDTPAQLVHFALRNGIIMATLSAEVWPFHFKVLFPRIIRFGKNSQLWNS